MINRAPSARSAASASFARPLLFAITLGALAAVGACGGGGDTNTGPQTVIPDPEAVARVDVSAPTMSLTPSQTVQVTATARNASGTTIGGAFPTWSTSAPAIATVSSTGLVTALTAGTATITATLNGKSGNVNITVASGAGTLATVTATLQDAAINLGDLTQAAVTARDGAGNALPLGTRTVTWTSENASVATVTSAGIVSAIGVGNADIRVSVAEGATTRTSSVRLTVRAIAGAPMSTEVFMPGNTFSPFQAVVKQGGSVSFVFNSVPHNVIWDRARTGAPADINTTSSTSIARVFPTAGLFNYTCTLHPGMDGQIIVTP